MNILNFFCISSFLLLFSSSVFSDQWAINGQSALQLCEINSPITNSVNEVEYDAGNCSSVSGGVNTDKCAGAGGYAGSRHSMSYWGAYGEFYFSCTEGTNNDCTAGQEFSFSVKTTTYSVGMLTICIGGCDESSNFNGCELDYDPYSSDDCYLVDAGDGTKEHWCNYTGTTNGNQASTSNTSATDSDSQLNPDPCIGVNGLNICTSGVDSECGTINGQEVCVAVNTDCGTVNGVEVCADDPTNCGYFNGEYICVNSSTSNTTDVCVTDSNGNVVCLEGESGVETNTDTSVTTNVDSSVTTTTTTYDNVVGGSTTTTTTTENPDGSTTSQTEKEGGDNEEGTGSIPSDEINVSKSSSAIDTFFTNSTNLLNTDSFNKNDNFLDFSFPDLSSGCQSITLSANTSQINISHVVDPCSKLVPFRAMFGWFLYILTAFLLFHIVTKPST